MTEHPALKPGRAAALRFAALGLKVCLADLASDALEATHAAVVEASPLGAPGVMAAPTDVSELAQVRALADAVYGRFGEVAVLMNNAATGAFGGPWDHIGNSDEVGHAFQNEAGHLFRTEAGRCSDLKPAT